jgi:hypothetical protein
LQIRKTRSLSVSPAGMFQGRSTADSAADQRIVRPPGELLIMLFDVRTLPSNVSFDPNRIDTA